MRKGFIISALLLAALFPSLAGADTPQLQDNAPDRYVVVAGDTLWDISAHFLKSPWRWPELWHMNQDEIKNPHWIYPGDVIVLDRSGAEPRMKLLHGVQALNGGNASAPVGGKLVPHIRYTPIDKVAIPALPMSTIGPFLSKPLVVEKDAMEKAPRVAAGPDNRVIISVSDKFYATGLDTVGARPASRWHVYRPGKALPDPDSPDKKTILGYEAVYLGDVEILTVAQVSTGRVLTAVQEIMPGDRLVAAEDVDYQSYVPHAPKGKIRGKIISSYNGVNESGQYFIVVIDRGARDGLDRGDVLTIERAGHALPKVHRDDATLVTPPEEYGSLMLFRIFDKVSYGLVMQTSQSVYLYDEVHEP